MSNVIELKFRSPHMRDDMMSFISCGHCRNKTYTLKDDDKSPFPLMICAACGKHMGRMGWVHDYDPEMKSPPTDPTPIT